MKHYRDRDTIMQGLYYLRHMEAMTTEGLYSKGAVASELAARDILIDALEARCQVLEGALAECKSELAIAEANRACSHQVFAAREACIRDLEAALRKIASVPCAMVYNCTAPQLTFGNERRASLCVTCIARSALEMGEEVCANCGAYKRSEVHSCDHPANRYPQSKSDRKEGA
jgi:hypothetical protein